MLRGGAAIITKKKWLLLLCIVTLTFAGLYGTNLFNVRRLTNDAAHKAMAAGLKLEYRISGRKGPSFVPILMYHSINDSPIGVPELSVRPADFETQMAYLAGNGYTPITFDQLADADKYTKPILITFDDAYYDNYSEAYPILKKFGFHATVFVITGDIGAADHLNGDNILAMRDLVSFQSHTVRHRRLSKLHEDELAYELRQSKATLETLTGQSVVALSYPEGNYSEAVLKLVPRYYRWAVTTKCGVWYNGADRYRIRRYAVGRSTTMARFRQLTAEA